MLEMSDKVLIIVRSLFRILSAVTPRIAGNLAFWLFCRPTPARKIRPVQNAMLGIASELLTKAKIRKIGFGDDNQPERETCIYTFEPEGIDDPVGTTLLLHGWSSRATHMLAFVRPLLAQGHRVIAVDLPAHGNAAGKSFHLPMGVEALHAIKKQTPQWTGIIAHSLGGAVATALVAGTIKGLEPVPVERLVLISAPNSIAKIFADFSAMLGLNVKAQSVLNSHVKRLSGNPLEKFIARRQLEKAGIATLVLHDPADKEVPIQEAFDLTDDSDFITFNIIQNAGHRRILYAPEAVELATSFCVQQHRDTAVLST